MSMIPFLDLKAINRAHRDDLIAAAARVIDSGWYVLGKEVKLFETEFGPSLRSMNVSERNELGRMKRKFSSNSCVRRSKITCLISWP
jgi:hypothetical protein